MYFDNVKLFDIKEEVDNLDNIYAHLNGDDKEKLIDHMDLAYKYFLNICKGKNLDNVFRNIEEKLLTGLSEDGKKFWKELLCNTIYMHDMGKINCNFQTRKMKNKRYKDIPNFDSKHSMSANKNLKVHSANAGPRKAFDTQSPMRCPRGPDIERMRSRLLSEQKLVSATSQK